MSKLLSFALPLALQFIPGVGQALGGALLGAGAAGSATLGNALIGAGTGALTGGGLKGAALGALGGGLSANIGSLGSSASGLSSTAQAGAKALGVSGASSGSGLLGALSSAAPRLTEGISNLGNSVGGLTGGVGGGSTFSAGNLLSSALGGYSDDSALKKAQQQLLAGNQQQLANIDSYDAGAYLDNPEYQFTKEEGEKALNRSLGASGGLFSGAALKAAADYNKGINTDFQQRDYQQYLNRVGLQNPLYASNANTQAATSIQRANNLGNTFSNVFNPQQGLSLDDLRRLGGRA